MHSTVQSAGQPLGHDTASEAGADNQIIKAPGSYIRHRLFASHRLYHR